MQRLKAWLKLKTAPDIGFQTTLKLVQNLGEPSAWTKQQLRQAVKQSCISPEAADYLASKDDPPNWLQICKYMENCHISYTTILDSDYPELLRSTYSPPPVLYYKGNLTAALQTWNLAVVGTRKPSDYGKNMTLAITEEIAKAGVCIVSGLAYGIDTCAHKAAVKAKGHTVAVLAHGLERIYPPQNHELAEQILENGAIVSEYEPGTKMERWNFPARNRIISGLSHAVLVMEGSLTSGALLTAKFALDYNRDLFALPGQVNLTNAQGPNHLIKNGAGLVTEAADILRNFGFDLQAPEQADLFPELSVNEQTVFDLIKSEQRSMSFDELILRTGFTIGQMSIVLLNLELKNLLVKESGNAYTLR